MTVENAYKKVKESQNKNHKLIDAKDFGLFYGFVFADKSESFGGAYDCVNKETGEVFSFMPYENFAVFKKGKDIDISAFL